MSPKSEVKLSDFSSGLAHKLCQAIMKAGGTPAEANAIAENGGLMRALIKAHRQGDVTIDGQDAPVEIIRWRKISDTCIEVNLDAPPVLPFAGARPVIWNRQSGWVRLELREDGELYRNGTKVELFLTEEQKTSSYIKGHELQRQLVGKICLHPNELDALMENIHLIPRSWEKDNKGRELYIFFWAVGFRVSGGNLCVRSLYRDACRWNRNHAWSALYWDVRRPAAIIAS